VQVPGEYSGSIIGDISARRGGVMSVDSPGAQSSVVGHVPLAGLFDYADKIRSLSQGRASSTMEPLEYRPTPADVLQRLLHPEDYY